MALDYLPSPSWAVIYGETPSADRWSELGENDDALATGAGWDDGAVALRHMADGLVTPVKRSGGFKVIQVQFTATGTKVVTGLGFKPKALIVLGHNRTSGSECTSTTGMAYDSGSGIVQQCQSFWSNGSTSVANASAIAFQSMASSVVTAASVTSMDADGFTCSVSAAAGGTSTYQLFNVLALG